MACQETQTPWTLTHGTPMLSEEFLENNITKHHEPIVE